MDDIGISVTIYSTGYYQISFMKVVHRQVSSVKPDVLEVLRSPSGKVSEDTSQWRTV